MADSVIPILSQTRIVPLTVIRRQRMLSVRGHVIATIGSHVDPHDIVAQSTGKGNLHPVPLGRYMQSSESTLVRLLRKQPGDEVEPREIIASRPQLLGTLQRIYRAPGAGRIAALEGTWMTIQLVQAPEELKALYPGQVVNVTPGRGITIEATGALVQGVWGDGGEGYGVLKKAVETPAELVTEDKIDGSVRGMILVAGSGITEQALRRAVQEQAAGMILGSLLPSLRGSVATFGMPTVVTEGFGEHPMALPIFELLVAHQGEEACLNAMLGPSELAVPELFLPAVSTDREPPHAEPLAPLAEQMNARVRLLAPPREGAIGKIVAIPSLPRKLESGVSARGAEIELAGDERVFVPWPNLELID